MTRSSIVALYIAHNAQNIEQQDRSQKSFRENLHSKVISSSSVYCIPPGPHGLVFIQGLSKILF